ncbi:hypothetical protein BOTBODRAFT_178671 [Botryobasidium botryosum FD-172 SS1]|uniref:Uncharacterized protein n=1 Tax=Botryobasidium botryosum (strain FD-172 SS1) TaxID=930990 RepID=A0A067MDJ7_BOTB1|nr:hypothetical protein BOTBODRAFT_178671 [Botryobasidium botryosum FD-172 SS1]
MREDLPACEDPTLPNCTPTPQDLDVQDGTMGDNGGEDERIDSGSTVAEAAAASAAAARAAATAAAHQLTDLDDDDTDDAFIRALEQASLDEEGLPEDILYCLRFPEAPEAIVDKDILLSLRLYLSLHNTSEQAYKDVREAILLHHPDHAILTWHQVKAKIAEITGVMSLACDMCIKSCMAYVSIWASLEECPYCREPCYDQEVLKASKGKIKRARQEFHTVLLGPQLEAQRSLAAGQKIPVYKDIIYVNYGPDLWYKKLHILPGGTIPGPNKPQNLDSFLFVGLHHLAALQQEGLRVWDAIERAVVDNNPYLLLGTADGPGLACLNGFVGHHDNYHVSGCTHEDIDVGALLPPMSPEQYTNGLLTVLSARNATHYEELRKATGIVKPTLFSGLS